MVPRDEPPLDRREPGLRRAWRHGPCRVGLVAQDLLGGGILKTRVGAEWRFCDRIAVRRVDLTDSRFDAPIPYDDASSAREEAMADTAPARCAALRDAVAGRRGEPPA